MRPTAVLGVARATLSGLSKVDVKVAKRATSFAVDGAGHSPLVQRGIWDGREHMMRAAGANYTLPIGLLPDLVRALEGEIDVIDERPPVPPASIDFGFDPVIELRDYQHAAVKAFCEGAPGAPSWARGFGILRMSVRSGKTLTGAAIIAREGRPAIFVVTSQLLLAQAADVFRRVFLNASVGVIGAGECTVGDVTVATVQGLLRARQTNKKLWNQVRGIVDSGLGIFDEAHHLTAKKWKKTVELMPFRMRLGLTATVFDDCAEGGDAAIGMSSADTILLRAATGPVLHEVTMRELMLRGFLVPMTIELLKVQGRKSLLRRGWSQDHWKDAIFDDAVRNAALVKRAVEHALEGRSVIFTTTRIEHAEVLERMIAAAGASVAVVVGPDPPKKRDRIIGAFRRRETSILVSTVLGEGVDIPECNVVVVGEGGASRIAALQRMRCLTPAPGKTESFLVDVIDTTSKYTAAHTGDRLSAYKLEDAFRIVVREA